MKFAAQSMNQIKDEPNYKAMYWRSLLSPNRFFDERFCPVFIAGVSGVGTTLLASLLFQNYHFDLYLNESVRVKDAKPALFVDKMRRYPDYQSYFDVMSLQDTVQVSEVRRQILNLYRKQTVYPKSSEFVLDKGPNVHLMRAALLHEAMPHGKFVCLFRDPAETVEGLRRKWPTIMGVVDLIEVCNFYQTLYATFIEGSKLFRDQVVFISYGTLVRQGEGFIDQLAAFIGVLSRIEKAILPERRKQPGKGVRNVVDGEIGIVKNAYRDVEKSISSQEEEFVSTRLSSIHQRLQQLELESTNKLLNVQ